MLLDSTKNSVNQIITILLKIQSLSDQQRKILYCDLNIGMHVRHVNDHFLALKKGIDTGVLDYNNRNRGTTIETNSLEGLNQLYSLIEWLDESKKLLTESTLNTSIQVISEIDCLATENATFTSTIAREFLYLINHTIHHAAHMSLIIKNKGIEIDQKIGLAPSTRSFLRTSNAS